MCFNSATPVKAWRLALLTLLRCWPCSFNSATPVKAWRQHNVHYYNYASTGLQFGHAGEGVETLVSGQRERGRVRASIRPRR